MVVIATNNKNKVYEFKSLFGNDSIEFKTLSEIGYNEEIIEDGSEEVEEYIEEEAIGESTDDAVIEVPSEDVTGIEEIVV